MAVDAANSAAIITIITQTRGEYLKKNFFIANIISPLLPIFKRNMSFYAQVLKWEYSDAFAIDLKLKVCYHKFTYGKFLSENG